MIILLNILKYTIFLPILIILLFIEILLFIFAFVINDFIMINMVKNGILKLLKPTDRC